tara:strand:+ start:8034 stop:8348 length:315 start_codon:yes stop_codon:yes gene_type:complete
MIDTDKYEGHSTEYSYEIVSVDDDKEMDATYALLNDAPLLLAEVKRLREEKTFLWETYLKESAEVKRLQKEIEVLSKYRDIVVKYDDALLADGDTDPRWSELYA